MSADTSKADTAPQPRFEAWVVVEIMGHQRYAGWCTEQTIAGQAYLRIDVPEIRGAGGDLIRPPFTKFFTQSAVFSLTPTTESLARVAALQILAEPVHLWGLPTRPAGIGYAEDEPDDDAPDEDADAGEEVF